MASQHGISRRDFLGKTLLTGAGLALASRVPWPEFADAQALVPGKEKLIIRSLRFYDLETPVNLFDSFITPVDLFFVRNHMSEPVTFDADSYRLKVTGEVGNPVDLSLADLHEIQAYSVTNTLECAGNGRAFYEPHVPGVQWQRGAVGNARWTGPRLKDVLERAAVKDTGKFVAFLGMDEPPGKVPKFVRGIPIEKAMDLHTLLAMQMNGKTLTKHHGYPVRALAPGWIGAASCKWLQEIRVLDKEFEGNFMKPGYRMPNNPVTKGGDIAGDTTPITRLNVKSIITSPPSGAQMSAQQTVQLSGVAWAGEADVRKVEISADNGQSWQPAELGQEHAKYAWRFWQYEWRPAKAGEYSVMVRATDSTGRVQPDEPPWNPSGYLWNGIEKVKIHVKA
jgi:DMSO/TMAO reductase YedYZ molybdopterin-dependent catalytic subunit